MLTPLTQPLSSHELRHRLLEEASEMASLSHPWFRGIIDHTLTREQIILGEKQHFLRVMRNGDFFGAIVEKAKQEGDQSILRLAKKNYSEEIVGPSNHTDLLFQFFADAGLDRKVVEKTLPTPGTAIAIEAMIGFCMRHSALEGMAFVGFVEVQNAGKEGVAYQVYDALIKHYGFSPKGAENFFVHSIEDDAHGNEQIDLICTKATTADVQTRIIQAVQAGVSTFSIEWDGHLQAALDGRVYWTGCSQKI